MIVEASQSLLLAANRLIDLSASPVLGVSIEAVIVIAAIVIGYALGFLIAKNLRAPEYGWKLGLVLAAFLGALPMVLFGNYKLGVDLQGGVILVYEVDKVETAALDPQGRSDNWDMPALIKVLGKRLNPDGLKEIVIRPFGTEQIEIVVPEVDSNEVELIKQRITTGGALRFMVVADPSIDQQLVEIAREQSQRPGLELEKSVKNGEELIGFWARAARETDGDPESAETAQFRDPSLFYSVIRDARTGQIIDLPPNVIGQLAQNPGFFAPYLQSLGHKQIDVLLTFNQDYDIRGEDLGVPAEGRDSQLRPCILFSMKGEGRAKMGALTSANLQRKLAIVFDNELLSAPTIQERISDNGQITGQFSEAEVRFMVEILKSGSMPVVLYKNPISENRIGSILGMDTIIKGSRAIIVSLLLVLGFVLVYYRVSGIVACFALVLNILLTVAAMILLQAPFTLPGLAGLVLTVGMSVDANVLIYERIREELARGAALRMAIRNGFERAFTTILDSNLTTLLTAVVLYVIGTDQIRGFGISLIFGILTSMFTAVFCSRVILELGERAFRWKTLEMTKFMTNPTIDWVKYFAPATTVSVVLILIGLVATIARGPGLFDIDLAGGTSVTFTLKEPIQDAEVRTMLDSVFKGAVNESTKSKVDYLINEVQVEGSPAGSNYKVDSSLEEVDDLKKLVEEAFTKDGKLLLTTFAMSADAPVEVKEATPPPVDTRTPETTPPATEKPGEVPAEVPAEKPAETPAAEKPAEAPKAEEPPAEAPKAEDKPAEEAPKTEEKPADEKPAEEKPAEEAKPAESTEPAAEGSCQEPAADDKPADEAKPEEKPAEEKPAETTPPAEAAPAEEKPADAPKTEDKPAEEKPAAEATPVPEAPAAVAAPEGPATTTETPATPAVVANEPEVKSSFKLTFDTSSISAQALRDRVLNAARSAINEDLSVKLENPDWDNLDQTAAFKEWTVTLPVSTDKAAKVIDAMKSELDGAPVWQTSSKIGGQVSSDTRWRAIAALAFSIAGMIAYIWYRFNNVTWGIAAAVALLHDSLIMLGAIAASLWLTSLLGFAGVEEFKISLPVVAAFLTLIGYSVNDTIVIFDRIREIRGKSPDITSKIVNDSVNQTLSRSLLTSGTTLMVVTILYFFGGPGVHAFAFALVIGVIAGSYSTIYIASPILLWLLGKEIAAPAAAPAEVVKK
ncbi:protein-export membrane protein SecD [Pirellula staleyi DSM 6068]|uniref:Multifunctional fusion protein n=1 Tax=Pirellula staleyi (strain ATCC 27377 / DSM 6068 / ICPB 4128) TaxID=530564 RepID=D2R231_PIRSD|nr:protein translocase subunit SecD [Pirellula staleyi]ADB18642.1 protein-export membrane protein SecD [Pirellula staleyi DSM 6068]